MTDTLDHAASVLADAIIDDTDAGVYRANRRIFTDEDIFELEMKHIFVATRDQSSSLILPPRMCDSGIEASAESSRISLVDLAHLQREDDRRQAVLDRGGAGEIEGECAVVVRRDHGPGGQILMIRVVDLYAANRD